MANRAVEVRGLTKKYKAFEALKGIDLNIEEGEFFGLLGPNGAGKSTLINILVGLARKTSGEARIFGGDVERDYLKTRQMTGVVPQEIVVDEFFTIDRTLDFINGYYGVRGNRKWIEEMLEALDLKAHRRKQMSQLSGGMKRRLLVAKALAHQPRLLILDEPTAGVDVALRQSLWRFVRKVNEMGTTVLLTTHYIEEAEELCGRVAIINDGALVAVDNKENMLKRLKEKLIRFELTAPLERIPTRLEGAGMVLTNGGSALEYSFSGDNGELNRFMRMVVEENIPVHDVAVRQPDLEDVFLHLTGNGKGNA